MAELKFAQKVYEAVKNIPRGKVATYRQIAIMCDSPFACRAVGNALHKNPNPSDIPCHRVVNSKGYLADDFVFGGKEEQAKRLIAEGVKIENGKVIL